MRPSRGAAIPTLGANLGLIVSGTMCRTQGNVVVDKSSTASAPEYKKGSTGSPRSTHNASVCCSWLCNNVDSISNPRFSSSFASMNFVGIHSSLSSMPQGVMRLIARKCNCSAEVNVVGLVDFLLRGRIYKEYFPRKYCQYDRKNPPSIPLRPCTHFLRKDPQINAAFATIGDQGVLESYLPSMHSVRKSSSSGNDGPFRSVPSANRNHSFSFLSVIRSIGF